MTDLLEPKAADDESQVRALVQTSAKRYPFGMPFGWFMVAWSHELERGGVLPRFLHGKHLVVWRDDHGTPHVQDAFCPHLGAHLGHGGIVRGHELECPFHGWRFDGDGRNTCIPYSERTNGKARVATYETFELGNHFVMAWFHPHGEPPKWQLELPPEATDPDFTEWTSVEFTVNAGQQELAENTVDGPHFRYVHNTDTVPEIEDYNTDGWIARTKSVQRFPTPRGVVDGRIDIENQGPGFGFTWFRGIVDTLLIGCSTPIDDEHTRVCFNFKTRKLADERSTRSVGEAFINEVCKQFEEDRPIWENKAHITRPALADTDPPFMKFRKWYARFYADGVADDQTVWEPAPPPDGSQPVFVRPEATASRKNRADS